MADEFASIEQTTVPAQAASDIHPLVGVANGARVLDAAGNETNEKVVYEYDADGKFSGWHKEQA